MKKLILTAVALAALTMTACENDSGGGTVGGVEEWKPAPAVPAPETKPELKKEAPKCSQYAGRFQANGMTITLTSDCKVYMASPAGVHAKGIVTSYSADHVSAEGCFNVNGAADCGKIRIYSDGRIEATSFSR